MKLKNIDILSERIKEAVLNNEQIILFGDSDMDGVSATVVAKEAISNFAFLSKKELKISAYFPDRKNEGYGLNDVVSAYIIEKYPQGGLLITLDCGITNFTQIKRVRAAGFYVMVLDHHQPVKEGLPEADIIVDPKQEDDDYPFKDFSNAGLSFKLAEELLQEKISPLFKENLLELVALATIADMMPERDENIDYIYQGLKNIENSQRPILKAFFTIYNPNEFNSKRDLVHRINSCFNFGAMDDNHVCLLYHILSETDFELAKEEAKELIEENQRRVLEINVLTDEIKLLIETKLGNSIIFEGSPNWGIEYLGAIASRLSVYYDKPVFIYQKYDDFSRGTVRLPKKYDAVKAMESCSNLLITFGGHPPAAGFTVANNNLERFRLALISYFNKENGK
ncbi:MAG: DHH family phosphoesterase [Candidatus Paceibacterota bacterium]|jgi:single-stranded-DNA-specific exonuclease|nr:DHH family phosphoesterase [bacterium]